MLYQCLLRPSVRLEFGLPDGLTPSPALSPQSMWRTYPGRRGLTACLGTSRIGLALGIHYCDAGYLRVAPEEIDSLWERHASARSIRNPHSEPSSGRPALKVALIEECRLGSAPTLQRSPVTAKERQANLFYLLLLVGREGLATLRPLSLSPAVHRREEVTVPLSAPLRVRIFRFFLSRQQCSSSATALPVLFRATIQDLECSSLRRGKRGQFRVV